MKKSYLKQACAIGALAFLLHVNPAAANQQAIRLNNQAMEMDKQGKSKEALAMLNEALGIDPRDIIILRNRCLVLRDLDRVDAAMADAAELLRREPHNPVHLLIRGSLFFRKREHDKALKDFNQALEQEPDNPEFIKIYDSYVSGLDAASYHYMKLRRLGMEGWSWDNAREHRGLVYPVLNIGYTGSPEQAQQALTPQAAEIRLHGRIIGRDTAKGTMNVEVVAFGTPNGGFKALPTPKVKTVHTNKAELDLGELGTFPLTALPNGEFVILVGQDKPTGFMPRRSFALLSSRPSASLKELYRADELSKPNGAIDLIEANNAAVSEPLIWPQAEAGEEEPKGNLGFLVNDATGPILFTTLPGISHSLHRLEDAAKQTQRLRSEVAKVPGEITWNKDSKLAITSRHVGTGTFAERHMAALRVKETTTTLTLAKQLPKRGDKVWTNIRDDAQPTLCVVLAADENRLVLLGDDPNGHQRQPGHPVLNSNGELIGMVLQVDDDVTIAAPIAALQRLVQQAPVSPAG